jgi:uroporphyrin-III C-methyltransferase
MDVPHLISIVGAGPGDPDLLTIKALQRIQDADVILYDALLGDEILALAKTGSIKKYVGKRVHDGQDQTNRQNAINNEFLYWAGENKKVVRLKTGDPMIFGRGAEEIRFCIENKLNYEVIPGVTAGVAAASLFSVSLTERGNNNMLLFYTSRDGTTVSHDLDAISGILSLGSPVLLYMGLNNLSAMAEQLIGTGIDTALPVLIFSRISQPEQKIYATRLGEVAEFLSVEKPATPAVVMIGKYATQI